MKKYNLVFFPFHDFDKWEKEGYRTRDAHLFTKLSERNDINKILIINRPESGIERIIKPKNKIKKDVEISRNNRCILNEFKKDIYILDFKTYDIIKPLIQKRNWWVTAYANHSLNQEIIKSIKKLNMEEDIIIYSNVVINWEAVKNIKDYFNNVKFVFDIVDDQTQISKNSRYIASIKKGYKLNSNQSDVLISTSKNVSHLTSRNITEISNGVNVDHFRKHIYSNTRNKLGFSSDDKIVFYIGKIHERIDFDIVESALKKYPRYKFVFCGPILGKNKFKNLTKKYEHLYWYGDVHYNDIPKFISIADVCIIPHKLNELTKTQSPLKLLEYISCGKPVVTTNINGVSGDLSKLVSITNNNEDFIHAIGKEIDKKTVINYDFPFEYTWEAKVQEIMDCIKEVKVDIK